MVPTDGAEGRACSSVAVQGPVAWAVDAGPEAVAAAVVAGGRVAPGAGAAAVAGGKVAPGAAAAADLPYAVADLQHEVGVADLPDAAVPDVKKAVAWYAAVAGGRVAPAAGAAAGERRRAGWRALYCC